MSPGEIQTPPGRAEGADPWKDVYEIEIRDETGGGYYYRSSAVDHARAVDDAKHQQVYAHLRALLLSGEDRIVALMRRVSAKDTEIATLTADRDALARQLAGLREALEEVEWVDTPIYRDECKPACPWCGGLNPGVNLWERHNRHRSVGHEPTCLRQAALAAFPEGGQAPASPEDQPEETPHA